MISTNPTSKVVLAIVCTIVAPLTYATSLIDPAADCLKPEVSGYSENDMSCIGEGFVTFRGDKGQGVVNLQGQVIIPLGRYEYITQASGGLIGVGEDGENGHRVGFVSQKSGKEVIPLEYVSSSFYPYYPSTNDFSEGLVAMKNPAKKWGYLDNQGNTVIGFSYDYADSFSEGLAAVCKDEDGISSKCGYIDKKDRTVIPFTYDITKEFSEGLASVAKIENETMQSSVIDKQGKIIFPFKKDRYIGPYSEGLAAIINIDTGRQGFINRSGKLVIPYLYMPIAYEDVLWLPSFKNGKAELFRFGAAMEQLCIDTTGAEVSC